MIDQNGVLTLAKGYEPYGEVLDSSGSGTSSYGYTGEWTDNTGLVYLRARYYDPGTGRFMTKDTWGGNKYQPLSLNRWTYVNSNPINKTDPSGMFPEWCKGMRTKEMYYLCILSHYSIRPLGDTYAAIANVTGSPGCFSGPVHYRGAGYLEGVGGFLTIWWGGREIVYDFATMERDSFTYFGPGANDSLIGLGMSGYSGIVSGFRTDASIDRDYEGPFFEITGGFGIDVGEAAQPVGLGVGAIGFIAWSDPRLYGVDWYFSGGLSADIIPGLELGSGLMLLYYPDVNIQSYVINGADGKKVNFGLLSSDILSGDRSPWPGILENTAAGSISRALALVSAIKYKIVYEDIQNAK